MIFVCQVSYMIDDQRLHHYLNHTQLSRRLRAYSRRMGSLRDTSPIERLKQLYYMGEIYKVY